MLNRLNRVNVITLMKDANGNERPIILLELMNDYGQTIASAELRSTSVHSNDLKGLADELARRANGKPV